MDRHLWMSECPLQHRRIRLLRVLRASLEASEEMSLYPLRIQDVLGKTVTVNGYPQEPVPRSLPKLKRRVIAFEYATWM